MHVVIEQSHLFKFNFALNSFVILSSYDCNFCNHRAVRTSRAQEHFILNPKIKFSVELKSFQYLGLKSLTNIDTH